MTTSRWLPLVALLVAPAWAQEATPATVTTADEAWAEACAATLELPPGTLARSNRLDRTRGGELRCAELRLELEGLTVYRRAFAEPQQAATFHRARAVWEPDDQPSVAQLRGGQLVVLTGPRAGDPPAWLARALGAAFAGEAFPAPGPCLELSLARPWRASVPDRDAPREEHGQNRVAFSRFVQGLRATYHAEVRSLIQRARRGLDDDARFVDLPLRNHALVPAGEDVLREYRLGADDTALQAEVRDALAAKQTWDALKALLAALEDPGFRPAQDTVGPASDDPVTPQRPGPPVDGALGD